MKSSKVLVTGGAGFIGAHTVVELAQAGMDPVILDDLSRSSRRLLDGIQAILGRKVPFYQVNCMDPDKIREVLSDHQDIDSVIHFAAFKSVSESVKNPLLYYENNIGSLLSLLKVMDEFAVEKFVFSSSCTVYGQPDQIPVTEDTPFQRAGSPYGATKQMCERILEDEVIARPSIKVISLRYFNPIGAHSSGLIGELPIGVPSNLVPFITQTAIGKRNGLTIYGSDYDTPDGTCLRDFIHVVDLAQAHVQALEKINELRNRFEAINLGTGVAVSVLELVKTFIRITGVPLKYTIGQRRPGDIVKVYANPSKAIELIDWKSKLSVEQALADAWRWEKKIDHAVH